MNPAAHHLGQMIGAGLAIVFLAAMFLIGAVFIAWVSAQAGRRWPR